MSTRPSILKIAKRGSRGIMRTSESGYYSVSRWKWIGRQTVALYPPRPEEGASTYAIGRRSHRVAPVSKDGAAHHGSRRRARGCGIQVGPRLRLLTMRAEKGPQVHQSN